MVKLSGVGESLNSGKGEAFVVGEDGRREEVDGSAGRELGQHS